MDNSDAAVKHIAALLALLPAVAIAAPPPNADRSQAAWWEGARSPETGDLCCGIADGRRVQVCYRDATQWSLDDMGWRIMLDGKCVPVPPHAVILGYPRTRPGALRCGSRATAPSGALCGRGMEGKVLSAEQEKSDG